MVNLQRKSFFAAMGKWLCLGHSVQIRYMALQRSGELQLLSGFIAASATPIKPGLDFQVSVGDLRAGQFTIEHPTISQTISNFEAACNGQISVYGLKLKMKLPPTPEYYGEPISTETWYHELHLQVLGEQITTPSYHEFLALEDELRVAATPFDGLADLAGWLHLANPRSTHRAPHIDMRIAPPVDMVLAESNVNKDQLRISLRAAKSFDVKKVNLAVRIVPGSGIARHLINDKISWGKAKEGYRYGLAALEIANTTQVLAMLSINTTIVRRHWFVDPSRARNLRLASIQAFDTQVEKLKSALLKVTDRDSRKFEKAINALLFLLGFASAEQLETDSPDIVAIAPSGRIMLVECTIKTSDMTTKVGKLVDRREMLLRSLGESSLVSSVSTVLVCAASRNQITYEEAHLKKQRITLMTREDLEAAINKLNIAELDADALIDASESALKLTAFELRT